MTVHSMYKNGNLVFYEDTRQRWLDAIGADVTKFILNPAYFPVDDTTGDPLGFTTTTVDGGSDGAGFVSLVDNKLVISTDNADNDGASVQLKGEAFDFASGNLVYFGIKMQASEATQSDFLVGLCITDTALLGGMTHGVYFTKVDASTDINFVLEKSSTATTSASAVGTFADATDIILEFLFDGTNVDAYVDGVLQTRLATTNLPNDEQLTVSVEFLTGAASVETLSIAWLRAIQINA